MRARFWGTRGSLPVALTAPQVRAKVLQAVAAAADRTFNSDAERERFVDEELAFDVSGTFGGNSPCIEIETDTGGDEYLICDLGSGVRPFSVEAMKQREGKPATYHVLLSHLHWDHIMGFPYFAPAYVPGNVIKIYGRHDNIEQALRRQQEEPSFPVTLDIFKAKLEFTRLEPQKSYEIAGCRVTSKLQHHSGDSFAYRIEHGGKSIVYTTDTEHKLDDLAMTESFVRFLKGADLVVFDSMYSLAEAMSVKEDWGHSSNVIGVELCQMAKARHLCLFHHEPAFDDGTLASILAETVRFEEITRESHAVKVSAAYDGLEIEI